MADSKGAQIQDCGHPKSDETSADGYTFCAVCAVTKKGARIREREDVQVMLALDLLLDVAYHDGTARDLAVAAEAYTLAGYHDGAIMVSHASPQETRAAVAAARKGRQRQLLRHDAQGVLSAVRALIHEGVLDGTDAARRTNERWIERGGHERAA